MDKLTLSYMAEDRKATGMTVNIPELTVLNFAEIGGQIEALRTALEPVLESTAWKSTTSITDSTNYDPAGSGGVRGHKAIIRWFSPNANGGEGQYGSNEIGVADISAFALAADGNRYLEGSSYNDLKAAFDDLVRSDDGAAVEVYEVRYVTRTL